VFPLWYFCNARNSNGARKKKSTRARKAKSIRNVSNCFLCENILVTRVHNQSLSSIFATPAISIVPATGNLPSSVKQKAEPEEIPVSEAVVPAETS
jgi:hypothetical protein